MLKIHVFDVDKLPRRVLDRTWPILAAKSAKNDPKMAPQDDPKSIKNRVQKMIKILIAFKTAGMRFWGRPGGMRGAAGEDYRRGEKSTPASVSSSSGNFWKETLEGLQEGRFFHICNTSLARRAPFASSGAADRCARSAGPDIQEKVQRCASR